MIQVGTCGFPVSRTRYYTIFNAVELQGTFYEMPSEGRMRSLRQEAPMEFEFAVKAFQGMTHPSNSPTWRRMKTKLRGTLGNYGLLRPTRENLDLWNEFSRSVKPLDPVIIIFQTPPTMELSEESVRLIIDFFRTIGGEYRIAWEPRGRTYEREDLVRKALAETNVLHVVDPLRRRPLVQGSTVYLRLHGKGPRDVNYGYKYTEEDLRELLTIIEEMNADVVYTMFNNVHMLSDAMRFRELILHKTLSNN
jgi:uncharacterized protein YecE (DUF72 family)